MTARIQFPIDYIEPVFRPPSEAHSLILPVTNGCSWNKCTFCDMYTAPQKKFRARDEERVLEEIRQCGERLIVQRRSEEHTSELQSRENLVCRLLIEKNKKVGNKANTVV